MHLTNEEAKVKSLKHGECLRTRFYSVNGVILERLRQEFLANGKRVLFVKIKCKDASCLNWKETRFQLNFKKEHGLNWSRIAEEKSTPMMLTSLLT